MNFFVLKGDFNPPSELTEDAGTDLESEEELGGSRSSLERQGHRGNTTVHVCWHRNTSVSMVDFSVAVEVRDSVLISIFYFPLSLQQSGCPLVTSCGVRDKLLKKKKC